MKRMLFLILFTTLISELTAQERPPFSNKGVNEDGAIFLPYYKGEYYNASLQTPPLTSDATFIKKENYNPALAVMKKFHDILTKSIWINLPQGVATDSYIGTDLDHQEVLGRPNSVRIRIAPYWMPNKVPEVERRYLETDLNVTINTLYHIVGSEISMGKIPMYFMHKQIGKFHGYPVYATNENRAIVVVSKKGVPPYIPVSREECIRSFIALYTVSEDSLKSYYRIAEKKTREMYQNLENKKAEMSDEMYDNFKSALELASKDPYNKPIYLWPETKERIKKYESYIENMSPEERKMPARVNPEEFNYEDVKFIDSSEDGVYIVRPNPALIDSTRLYTSPQLMVIRLSKSLLLKEIEEKGNSKKLMDLAYYTKWKFIDEYDLWEKVIGLIDK